MGCCLFSTNSKVNTSLWSLWSLLTWKLLLTDVSVRGLSENSPSRLSVCEAAVSCVSETRVWEAGPRVRTRVRWGKGKRRIPSSSVRGMRSGAASDSGLGRARVSPRRLANTSACNGQGLLTLMTHGRLETFIMSTKLNQVLSRCWATGEKSIAFIIFHSWRICNFVKIFRPMFCGWDKNRIEGKKRGIIKLDYDQNCISFARGAHPDSWRLTMVGWNCNIMKTCRQRQHNTAFMKCMKCEWIFTSEVATDTKNTAHCFNR